MMNDKGRQTMDDRRRSAAGDGRDVYQPGVHYALRPHTSVELHIAELTLDGFASLSGELVGASIERALARLFVERGVPDSLQSDVTVRALDMGAFRMEADADGSDIGAQIARVIYEGFVR